MTLTDSSQIKLGTKTKQKHTKKKKTNRPKKPSPKNPKTTESNLTVSMNDVTFPLQEGKKPAMSKILSFQLCRNTLLWFSYNGNCTAHAFSSH